MAWGVVTKHFKFLRLVCSIAGPSLTCRMHAVTGDLKLNSRAPQGQCLPNIANSSWSSPSVAKPAIGGEVLTSGGLWLFIRTQARSAIRETPSIHA
jgi:hypothetical protein